MARLRHSAVRGSATIALLSATIALLGWWTRTPWMTGAVGGFTSMKVPSIVGFGFAAVALMALTYDVVPLARRIAFWSSIAVLLIGLAIMAIHERGPIPTAASLVALLSTAPGGVRTARPSMLTGLGFTLFAIAWLNTLARGRRQVTEIILLFVLALSVLSLMGMLFLVDISPYSVYHNMSVPTVVAMLALAFGGLSLAPDEGYLGLARRRSVAGVAFRGTLIAAVVIPTSLGGLRLLTERYIWLTDEIAVTGHALVTMLAFVLVGWLTARMVERADAGSSAVFAAAPGGMLVVDHDAVIRRANIEAERIFGASPDGLAGRRLPDLIPEVGRIEGAASHVEHDTTTPVLQVSAHFHARRLDGTMVEVDVTRVPVTLVEGPRQIYSIANLSERRKAEFALFESEQRFRQSFESASLGAAIVAVDGRWLEVNPALCKMLGYTEDELLARRVQDVTHPDDVAADSAEVRELRDGVRASFDYNKRYLHKDGSTVWVTISGSLIRDVHGQPRYFVALVQNITERHLAEQRLAETLAFQSSILQGTSAAIIATDTQGRITAFNRGAERMLGYQASEIIGRALVGTFLEPSEIERQASALGVAEGEFGTALDRLRAHGRIVGAHEQETFYRHKDGTRVSVLVSVSPLEDAAGNPAGFLGVATDITERKAAADALASSLAETQTLLREIHHRVKNNLQVISSMLSMQSRGNPDANVRAMFEEARERIHAMSMVHERLYRSQQLATIDMAEQLRDLVVLQGRAYQRGDREIAVDVVADPIELPIDSAVPLSLLANELLSNAYKHGFADGRSGRIEVSLRRTGDELCLRVFNDGHPFPEALDLQRVNSFGMTLIQALTAQLDGSLTLERTSGTTISVTFAVAEPLK